jgi:aminoglycoside 6'-N-acetyltransferase I
MHIRPATIDDLDRWAEMRAALWPDEDAAAHRKEVAAMLDQPDLANFIAVDGNGMAVGFIEAALRHDYVNGCDTSPVVFGEGLYVRDEARRAGVARALVDAIMQWGLTRGCSEMASDADIANIDSHAFHAAVGFEETERVVYFRREIG